MTKELIFLGVNLAPYVTEWGSIEQVKELLLMKAKMFSSEHPITLDNSSGILSGYGTRSIVAGANWYGKEVAIKVNGVQVYSGQVKNIEKNDENKTATIISENRFRRIAETTYVGSAARINPASAMLTMLLSVLEDSDVDIQSFYAAGASARKAGANVSYMFQEDKGIKIMRVIQQISSLSGISVYEEHGRIRARHSPSYQGSESNMRFTIDDSIVREWGPMERDTNSFANRCMVYYTKDEYAIYTDAISVAANDGTIRSKVFQAAGEGRGISAHDYNSAYYFARNYVAKSGYVKELIEVISGKELWDLRIGHQHPISRVSSGYNNYPMEVYESHRDLDTEAVMIKLAGLIPA